MIFAGINIPTLMISIPTWSLAPELDEGANDHGGMLIINEGMLMRPFPRKNHVITIIITFARLENSVICN